MKIKSLPGATRGFREKNDSKIDRETKRRGELGEAAFFSRAEEWKGTASAVQ